MAVVESLPVTWTGVRGILFDVDGTLTDSDNIHFSAFGSLLAELNYDGGKPITREFFNQRISGRHNPDIAADLFPSYSAAEGVHFTDRKEALFRALAKSDLERIRGLTEFLELVDRCGLRKIAVTNAPPANVELMLSCIGLSTYFEDVVYGERCERAKPFPDPYLVGLAKLGLQPHEVLVFEDSPSGIRSGVAAGLSVIALGTSQNDSVLLDAGASLVVPDYHAVVRLIEAQRAAV